MGPRDFSLYHTCRRCPAALVETEKDSSSPMAMLLNNSVTRKSSPVLKGWVTARGQEKSPRTLSASRMMRPSCASAGKKRKHMAKGITMTQGNFIFSRLLMQSPTVITDMM